jgi:hypothetical protein
MSIVLKYVAICVYARHGDFVRGSKEMSAKESQFLHWVVELGYLQTENITHGFNNEI